MRQALSRGHAVTAFTRSPDKLNLSDSRLRISIGDVQDARAVADAVQGHDAVIVALGTTLKDDDHAISRGTENIIAGMKSHQVDRIVVLSAWGTGDSRIHGGFFLNQVVRPFLLKHPYDEHELQEQSLSSSGLAWTVVRPGRLTNGPQARALRGSRTPEGLARRVSRADVAAFMLAEVETPNHTQKAVLIG